MVDHNMEARIDVLEQKLGCVEQKLGSLEKTVEGVRHLLQEQTRRRRGSHRGRHYRENEGDSDSGSNPMGGLRPHTQSNYIQDSALEEKTESESESESNDSGISQRKYRISDKKDKK